ncbi:phage tail tube protein [Pseudarthrobacter sp. HLT3-5]|uniref:phage tail tube protein n=1 Tax=Pseudarthrobacter cellobiosi TaxID=2953654 RepID=UPI00208FBE49|nr:phage tail tube protein [Pseudarthrobacter sp. HLT3-5]MCO4274266.1 phage tail tube protein [Pseudarthrobacter sp. HLT3-5]
MATADQHIGRRVGVGIGIEATPGVTVAPQTFLRWDTNDLQPKTNVVEDDSAMGVVDEISDSGITSRWAEGTLGGKISAVDMGFFFLGHYGAVTTGAAVAGVYPHTFSVKQSSIPTTVSLSISSPLQSQRHGYGVFETLEITAEQNGYVNFSAAVKARVGVTSSETVAYTAQNLFTSKHITLKIADTSAALGAAAAISALSVKFMSERPSEAVSPLGTMDEVEFDRGSYKANGEFVVRLKSTEYEEAFLANTVKALRISMVNGNDGLEITATKVRYRELEQSRDKNDVVTATIQYFCEYDTAVGASNVPVLKNSRASYVAA